MMANRRAWALAPALLLTIMAIPATAPVETAAAAPRIVAPTHGKLVTGATLTVRIRRAAPGMRVLVNSTDVTKRFRRGHDGVRRALLRRGRDFALGRNRLVVTTRKAGADAASFIAARRARGMLTVRRLPRRASRAAVHVRARVKRPVDQLRMTLNGRRVPKRLWPHTKRSFDALLGADEGTRFGVNRLVTTAIRDSGRYERVVRHFRVTRAAPLVGAGPDRRTKVRRAVRLDGRSTRRAPRGTRVAYRWRIVRAPRGSRATLRRSRSARPSLLPDKRGVYRVRLAATPRRSGRAGAAQAAPTSVDEVSVQAAPAIPPIGMPIQTIADGGGIQLGTAAPLTTSDNWVQVLVLDAATLEVLDNDGYAINESSQLTSDLSALQQQDQDVLVILSGGGRSFNDNGSCVNGWSQANANALQSAYDMLGGDRNPAGQLYDNGWTLCDGQWSLIGRFGNPAGTSVQNHASVTGGNNQPGSLTGYLQLNQYDNYAFVSPDYANIDTNVTGATTSSTSNTIEVNGTSYTSGTIPQGDGGFQVLVLNSQLQQVTNQTFLTNSTTGPNDQQVETMNALLRSYDPGPAAQNLVIVQSIGQPGAFDGAWVNDQNPVANDPGSWAHTLSGAIGRLGGPAAHDQFAQLIAPARVQPTPSVVGGYTLVASTQLTDPWSDAYSQSQAGSGLSQPRVVGTLSRNNDSQWVVNNPSATPDVSASDGFNSGAISELAYQNPEDFPYSSGDYLTASQWIAGELGLSAPDVRSAYYEESSLEWGDDVYRQLNDLEYDAGNGFSAAEFATLKTQLLNEFTMVSEVWGMVADWQQIFGDTTFGNYVNLQQIATDVLQDISAEQQIDSSQSSIDPLAVMGSSLWIAQGLIAFTGQEEVEPLLGTMAAVSDLADSLSTQGVDGAPSTAPIVDEAQHLGEDLATRYTQLSDSFAQIGNLFVSDYGKLQTASSNSDNVWSSNSTKTETIQQVLTRSTQASFYTSLIPVAYGQYVLQWQPTQLNSAPWQDPWNYACTSIDFDTTYPFGPTQGNPASYVIGARTFGDVGNGVIDTWRQVRIISTGIDWAGGQDERVEHEPQVLPSNISQMLFQPTSTETGLGLDQFWFFGNPAFRRWNIECHEVNQGR